MKLNGIFHVFVLRSLGMLLKKSENELALLNEKSIFDRNYL